MPGKTHRQRGDRAGAGARRTDAGEDPRPAGRAGRGRPVGSIKLTPEKRGLLIAAVEAGGTDHACARAAGIDTRTYRTWRAIAEGRHPTRKPTRDLIELFRQIDEAKARSRIRREMQVAEKHPREWLRYQAPSEPGLPGWTERVPDEPEADDATVYQPTPEEHAEIFRVLVESGAIPNPFDKEGTDEHEEPEEAD